MTSNKRGSPYQQLHCLAVLVFSCQARPSLQTLTVQKIMRITMKRSEATALSMTLLIA
jgi:hypothetical protein